MKKLMIAFAAVAMAVLANAATVSWGTGQILDTGLPGASGKKMSSLAVSVYEITAAEFTAFGDDMAKVYDAYKAGTGSFASTIATKSTNAQGKGTITDGSATSWAASSDHYIAVIATTTGTDTKTYYIANTVNAHVGADAATTLTAIATKLHDTGSAISWQTSAAAPEPTSGLLLLLGMAGLALKRKRA